MQSILKHLLKHSRALCGATLLMSFALFLLQCSPSYEEVSAENVPKLKVVLARHKTRIYDYKNKLMQLREILQGIDTPFVSPVRLQPILRTGNTGAPQNLLIYARKELDDPAMIADFSSHYGMFCTETFKHAIYAYKEHYLINSFDDEPEYLERRLAQLHVDSFPYALIMEEVNREKLVLDATSFSGGTVQVKVYLVDMRTLNVLGCERIIAEPPVMISTRTHEYEDRDAALSSEVQSMINLKVEEQVILFLKKFNGFIYNCDIKTPEE